MKRLHPLSVIAWLLVALFGFASDARATQISWTISTTLTIYDDSELVGDVTCTVVGAPCIAFGASGISLKLNAFIMTGLGNVKTGCGGAAVNGEFGIDVNTQQDVVIRGPGLVQQFRNQGIPCGGIWLTAGTSHNRLRRNRLSGNGYAAQGSNFGIGLVAAADQDNIIEDNTILGNTNGIIVAAGASGNIFRRNVVAGNPPIQISNSFPADNGVDIRSSATPGANTFKDNICLTSVNAPCPALGRQSDHDDHEKGDDKDRKKPK